MVPRLFIACLTIALGAAAMSVTAVPTSAATSPPADGSAAAGAGHGRSVTLHRGGADKTVVFHRRHTGEAFVDATVSAHGVRWVERKNESAVVSAYVDGRYATDIVIMSAKPVTREFALGRLAKGRHTLRLHYAAARSRSEAGVAKVADIGFRTIRPSSPAYAAARYAPILRGRNVEGSGGRFQNNRSDTPLVAYHQVLPTTTPGRSEIEYTVIWSNEDGGTNSAGLMAQWGRTTDIEWVYRVEVNAKGRRVDGSEVFQAPNHGTQRFRGSYDGTHPVLQTCTLNNNVCDRSALRAQQQKQDPMRFALSARRVLPADQPREHQMDVQPWTYQVMAREMVREKKVESEPDPMSLAVGDQRTYLYLALDRETSPAGEAANVGLVVEVTLTDDETYRSDHEQAPILYSVHRDGPVATTVELPAGTTQDDIASISVRRVSIVDPDSAASVTVTDLDRAFFLDRSYLPQPSFASVHGATITLTPDDPARQIWAPV
jgi:hypothetical protein